MSDSLNHFETFAELNKHLEECDQGCDLCDEQVESIGNYNELVTGNGFCHFDSTP